MNAELGRLARALAKGLTDGEGRRLARDGPQGEDIEPELPGDAARRIERAGELVQVWSKRGLIDAELRTLGSLPIRALGAGVLPLTLGLPPAPCTLSAGQLQAWLRLASSPELAAVSDLPGAFLDRALSGPSPTLAMRPLQPGDRARAAEALSLAMLTTLAERDPDWPYLPDEAAAVLLPALLDLERMRVYPRGRSLAVEVPARAGGPGVDAALAEARRALDAATVERVRARCGGGLRLLLPVAGGERGC